MVDTANAKRRRKHDVIHKTGSTLHIPLSS